MKDFGPAENRPSLFDRLNEDLYHSSASATRRPKARQRPLLSRRAQDRQKFWATVFCGLVLGLAAGGWQWCLYLSRADDSAWFGTPTTLDVTPVADLSVLEDTPSASADSEQEPIGASPARTELASSQLPRMEAPKKARQKRSTTSSPGRFRVAPESLATEDPVARNEPAPSPARSLALRTESRRPASIAQIAAKDPSPTETQPAATAPTRPAETPPTSSGVQSFERAAKLHGPQPAYPVAALRSGIEGAVLLEARIDPRGQVGKIDTLEAVDPTLEQAAREALAGWRFKPAERNGEAVEDRYRVRFRFAAPEDIRLLAQHATRGEDRPPVKIISPLPTYPPAAWAANTRGEVKLRVLVDEQGQIDDIELVSGLPNGVTEATIAAVEQWKFKPALQNGQPIASYEDLTFRF